MTARITVGLEGLDQAQVALASVAELAEDPVDFFDVVGAALVASTQFRFEEERDPDGDPWPPSMRAIVENGRTLTDTARLLQSITHEADSRGVSVGTDVIYAGVHQFGAIIRAKNAPKLAYQLPGGLGWRRVDSVKIPARPFLGVDAEDAQEITEIWKQMLTPFGVGEA